MLIRADARTLPLQDHSVHCIVTSPPYFGLRDYGAAGQIGLEPTPDAYVSALVAVFRELSRVLKPDGTVWLNLGDSFAGQSPQRPPASALSAQEPQRPSNPSPSSSANGALHSSHTSSPSRSMSSGVGYSGSTGPLSTFKQGARNGHRRSRPRGYEGLDSKQLMGIPWRVAFALQADGWYLRSDIIWHKPNPMPESVTDRPTKAHEYLFLLAKQERYHYDAEAIAEPMADASAERYAYAFGGAKNEALVEANKDGVGRRTSVIGTRDVTVGRNRRSVWTIPTLPYAGAHFATMPEKLVEPCILAGCPKGGVVLDPFVGSGTVVVVAERLARRGVGVDLSYQGLAKTRTAQQVLRFEEALV